MKLDDNCPSPFHQRMTTFQNGLNPKKRYNNPTRLSGVVDVSKHENF